MHSTGLPEEPFKPLWISAVVAMGTSRFWLRLVTVTHLTINKVWKIYLRSSSVPDFTSAFVLCPFKCLRQYQSAPRSQSLSFEYLLDPRPPQGLGWVFVCFHDVNFSRMVLSHSLLSSLPLLSFILQNLVQNLARATSRDSDQFCLDGVGVEMDRSSSEVLEAQAFPVSPQLLLVSS